MTSSLNWESIRSTVNSFMTGVVKPLRNCAAGIGFLSKVTQFFNVTVPPVVDNAFDAAAKGKSAFDILSFGADWIDLGATEIKNEDINPSLLSTAGNVTSAVKQVVDCVKASADLGLIEHATIAKCVGSSLPILDMAGTGLNLAASTVFLINNTMNESPYDAPTESVKNSRWSNIGWGIFDVACAAGIAGASCVGISPAPLIVFRLSVGLVNEGIKGYQAYSANLAKA